MPRYISRVILTIVLCSGIAWAVHPLLSPPQGLHSTDTTYSQLVRERYPVRLIDPAWLSDDMHWSLAETAARLGALAVCFTCFFVFRGFGRHEKLAA